MKKITLVCAGGFSTSLLVTKMEQAAKAKGVEVLIRATAESKFKSFENDTDVLLLGPQVSYLVDELKVKYKDIKVGVIDSIDYGMMNGEKVLNYALNI